MTGDAPAALHPAAGAALARGTAAHRAGRLAEAAEAYTECLAQHPDQVDALVNLGVALRRLGRLEAARTCLERAVALRPDGIGALTNCGNLLREAGAFDVARRHLERAVELSPGTAAAWHNLALTHQRTGDFEQADRCFERAIAATSDAARPEAARPDSARIIWDHALSLLMSGDYRRGFAAYEARFRLPEFKPRHTGRRRWDGRPLDGARIIAHAEQGLGDAIHFARYVAGIAERGGSVILECPKPAVRLLADLPDIVEAVEYGTDIADADWEIPLMSLPAVLGVETLPAPRPYLFAAPPSDALEGALPAVRPGQLRVGLVWAGSPTHSNDAHRSAPLDVFLPLAGLPHVRLVSLLHGPRRAEIAAAGAQALITDPGETLGDLKQTAALIAALDLVITIDTMTAHLAGALGVPCWVALSHRVDWRWGWDRRDTRLYANMRLFRQPVPGDWVSVVAEIREALQQSAQADRR